MGTRGFVGLVVDGVEHIAYNHMSSGPDWLGKEVLGDLTDFLADHTAEELRARAAALVSPRDLDPVPTVAEVMGTNPAFAEKVARTLAGGSSPRGTLDDNDDDTWRWWIEFDGLADMLDLGVYESNEHFPLNSGHCEWGYLVDLDRDNGPGRARGVLEVYRGFQEQRPLAGRWAGRPTPEEDAEDQAAHEDWCAEHGRDPWIDFPSRPRAVAPVAVWALDALPGLEVMDDLYRAHRAKTLRELTDTTVATLPAPGGQEQR